MLLRLPAPDLGLRPVLRQERRSRIGLGRQRLIVGGGDLPARGFRSIDEPAVLVEDLRLGEAPVDVAGVGCRRREQRQYAPERV